MRRPWFSGPSASLVALALAVAAAVAVGLPSTAADEAAPVALRWKLEPGRKLPYVMEQKTVMSMEIGGMKVQSTNKVVMDSTMAFVKTGNDGKAEMTLTTTRLRFQTQAPPPNPSVDYDSADPEKKSQASSLGPVAGIFEAWVGAPISFKMDGTGKTSDVTLPEKLANALKELPSQAGGTMFSEQGMKQLVEETILRLPEESVSKDKSWNDHRQIELPNNLGTMHNDLKYMYLGGEVSDQAKLEKIDFKATFSIQKAPGGTVEVKVKSQESKGTVYFDNNSGHTRRAEGQHRMVLALDIAGQTMEQTLDSTMVLKLGTEPAAEAKPAPGKTEPAKKE
jgi:hypothetical protein